MRANVISRKQGLATLWVHAGCRPFVECRVARALKARAGDTQVGGRQRERAKREGGTGDTPPDLVTPKHGLVPNVGPAALERTCRILSGDTGAGPLLRLPRAEMHQRLED